MAREIGAWRLKGHAVGNTPSSSASAPKVVVSSTWQAGGEPWEGANFTRSSDKWDLSYRETQAVHLQDSVISFEAFPGWVRETAKEWVEHNWLARNLSNGAIRSQVRELLLFSEFVSESAPGCRSIYHLKPEDLHAYLSLKKGYKHHAVVYLGAFADWLRGKYPNTPLKAFLMDRSQFRQHQKAFGYLHGLEKVVPAEVRTQLMSAINQEERSLWKQLEHPGISDHQRRLAHKRLVMCQALKLLILTGRRCSHITRLDRNPLRQARPEEATGIWLVWNETKFEKGKRPVFIPAVEGGDLASVAAEAVRIAQELTEPLVAEAHPLYRELLFLRWDFKEVGDGYSARLLTRDDLDTFVNGGWSSGGRHHSGLIHRYNIRHGGEIYHIRFHGFRHARATALHLGGAGIGTIRQDLVHSNTTQTGVYVHGIEPVLADVRRLHDADQLLGTATPLLKDKWVRIEPVREEDIDLWRQSGMTFQPTRYGYCVLPEAAGPCPSGDPCWIGPKGCGCVYHLYGPAALGPVEEDVNLVRYQLEQRQKAQPNSPLIGKYRAILSRYDLVTAEIRAVLKDGVDTGK